MATSASQVLIHMMIDANEDLGLSSVNDDSINLKVELNAELRSNTTPDAELVYKKTLALTAGALTIDLTALTNTLGETIATTGKKVRAIAIVPTSTNTGALTFTEGSSNGYELGGNTWKYALTAGQYFMVYCDADTPDVAAGAKTIDVTGTGTETFDILIIFG